MIIFNEEMLEEINLIELYLSKEQNKKEVNPIIILMLLNYLDDLNLAYGKGEAITRPINITKYFSGC